jgi:hypothetical protein
MAFVLCIANRGAEDLEVRKVYRVVPDKAASTTGHVRVIDESGEDYLYPAGFFVSVEVPRHARHALIAAPSLVKSRVPRNMPPRAAARSAPGRRREATRSTTSRRSMPR